MYRGIIWTGWENTKIIFLDLTLLPSLGTPFFASSDELQDLILVENLQRLLSLAMDYIRSAGAVAKDVALAIGDTVMSTAIDSLQLSRSLFSNNNLVTAN